MGMKMDEKIWKYGYVFNVFLCSHAKADELCKEIGIKHNGRADWSSFCGYNRIKFLSAEREALIDKVMAIEDQELSKQILKLLEGL